MLINSLDDWFTSALYGAYFGTINPAMIQPQLQKIATRVKYCKMCLSNPRVFTMSL